MLPKITFSLYNTKNTINVFFFYIRIIYDFLFIKHFQNHFKVYSNFQNIERERKKKGIGSDDLLVCTIESSKKQI